MYTLLWICIFLIDPVFFKTTMLASGIIYSARLVQGPRGIIFSYGMASAVSIFKPCRKCLGATEEVLASLNTSSFFVERYFATFARTLNKYSFGLFAKSCRIYASVFIISAFYHGPTKFLSQFTCDNK